MDMSRGEEWEKLVDNWIHYLQLSFARLAFEILDIISRPRLTSIE